MDFNLPMPPDEYYKAKLAALREAQDRHCEELAIKEASTFAPPELSRAERRRQARNSKKLLKVRP